MFKSDVFLYKDCDSLEPLSFKLISVVFNDL